MPSHLRVAALGVLAVLAPYSAALPFKHAVRLLSKNGTVSVVAGGGIAQSYNIKLTLLDKKCEVLHAGEGQVNRLAAKKAYITSIPQTVGEDDSGDSATLLLNIYAPTAAEAWARGAELCPEGLANESFAASPARLAARKDAIEIRPVREAGPSENRIDVVLMGDGYTLDQRETMFVDMKRLVDDMWGDVTFESFLPVFNIWALFDASVETGIGVMSTPRDTAYGLYRDGTQLRGIFSSRQQNARDNCALAPGCDYPSMIGNDPFYGGLGGEFVIATESPTSGTIVLRHEMGHNFINVGEEYDDGSVYRGINYADSVASAAAPPPLGWENWLNETEGPLREEQAEKLLGEYPWHDLASGARSFTFTSTGTYKRWFLRFTASGCEVDGSLIVRIDGVQLEWRSGGNLDRLFYSYSDMEVGFTAGEHTLEFEMGTPPAPGAPIRQLCSLTMHEYMGEDLYHFDNHYIGAYPTWSVRDVKSYRPSNERCLMRNMSSPHFCAPCKEGMWMQFFSRMSIIDNVTLDYDWTAEPPTAAATLHAVKLGQLREVPIDGLDERLLVRWVHNSNAMPSLDDQFDWTAPLDGAEGDWTVTVLFQTSEVRHDPDNLLTFEYSFNVGEIPPQHRMHDL